MHEADFHGDGVGKGRYLVFTLWADDYALEADAVRELLRPPPLIRVPGAPPALSGLANLRGAPLPVLDLRRVVQPGREPDAEPSRVIVANAGEPVGLLVDRVVAFSGGTVSVDENGPSASRRLILFGSGEARLIDLPTLVTETFPRRARMTGSGTAQGARGIAPARIEAEAERVALVTFTAGGQTYALPLERVAEVMALPVDVVPVPRAAEAALGVIGLRGGVLPLLSLAALLGLGMNAADSDARVVVTRIGGAEVGLVVQALGPILRLASEAVEPVPAALRRGGATAVDAICRADAAGALLSVLSPDRLLEGTIVNATSGRAQDGPGAGAGAVTEQFVVFDLAGESYGLPVSSVREVLRVPPAMTRLPRSPEIIAGAIEVRGTVLAVIDQRRRFGLPPGNADARRRIIVLDGGGTAAGLLVDGVSRLLRLSSDAVRSAPDLAGEADTAVGRVATLENGELLPIVDARALLNGTEKAIRAVAKRSDGSGSKANTGA